MDQAQLKLKKPLKTLTDGTLPKTAGTDEEDKADDFLGELIQANTQENLGINVGTLQIDHTSERVAAMS